MHRGCNWLFWLTTVAGIFFPGLKTRRPAKAGNASCRLSHHAVEGGAASKGTDNREERGRWRRGLNGSEGSGGAAVG